MADNHWILRGEPALARDCAVVRAFGRKLDRR